MDKYFDGELLSGFEESPKTTTSRYEQLGYCEYRDVKTGKEYKEQEDLLSKIMASNSKLHLEVDELKQQLAESKKKASKNYQEGYDLYLSLKQFYSRLGVEAYPDNEIQDVAIKELNKLLKENEQLKQQLAEKDEAIEGLQEINQSLGQTCNNDAKEIERLREQLHTANQETLHFQNKYFAEKQIAIEELDKVKVKLLNSLANVGLNTYCEKVKPVENYIDQQIKELKGEK